MRILVTGGRGLLGTALARRLAPRHELHALGSNELDVTDESAVLRAVGQVRPDRVVHLAAMTDVDGCERDPARALRVNGDGTRNVALACREGGTPLLHVSTDYVFDGGKDGPWTESDPVNPLSAYGRSKLAAEEHVRATAPHWTIVRAQSLYGTGKKSFPDAILARARSGEPLRVVTDQRVSPTWVEDLAAGIAALLACGGQGVYHVANGGSCTWYECARATLDLAGLAGTPIAPTTAAALARPAPRPANSAFDCARFERETGEALRPWRAALAAYLATAKAREEKA
jgi:dTDP-4-dehydrorhamnose reductase